MNKIRTINKNMKQELNKLSKEVGLITDRVKH